MIKKTSLSIRAGTVLSRGLATTALVAIATGAHAQTTTAPAASPTSSSPFAQSPRTPLPTANPPDQSSPTPNSPAERDPAAQTGGDAAAHEVAPADAAGSEVVVTGQRAALRSATDIKRNSDIILDSINADEAGKLPDNSVTEVLQRIPGVSISRIQTGANVGAENFLAEGTGVQIRGLTSVLSLLNGRDTFSSVNGNVLAFEDVPPELLQGVDVYKTLEANLPVGGLGGTVNLRTRQPFDFKGLHVDGAVEANYADFADKAHPDGNILVSDRWDTKIGQVGLLVDYAYSDLSTRADGVQVQPYLAQVYDPTATVAGLFVPYGGTRLPYLGDPGAQQVFVPEGIDLSSRLDDRKRQGIYAALQWRPNDKLIFGLNVFNSQYRMDSLQHYVAIDSGSNTVIPAGSTATFGSNGFLTSTNNLGNYGYVQANSATSASGGGDGGQGAGAGYSYPNNPYDFQSTLQQSFNYTTDISLTGDWQPTSKFDLKFAYQHVSSGADETDKYAYDYAYLPPVGVTLSPYGNSTLPKVSVPSTVNLTDPANYGYLATLDHLTHNRGREDAIYADGAYKISDTGLVRSIDFGFKLTTRYENDQQTPYNYQGLSPFYDAGPYSYLSGAASGAVYPQYNQLINTGQFFDGKTGLPAQTYFPSITELRTNFGTLHQQLGTGGNNTQQPIQFVDGDTTKINENEESVYAMALFRNDTNPIVPFRGNVGLRVVDDTHSASGALLYPSQQGLFYAANTYPASLGYTPSAIALSNPQTAYSVRGGHSEVDVLPSLNIQFLPTPALHVRFAASEGVGRPSFAQISPQGTLGSTFVGTFNQNFITSIIGDPRLKSQKAFQLDASIEYYFHDGGVVSLAAFYKRFDHFIGTRSVANDFVIPTSVVAGGYLATSGDLLPGASITPCPAPIAVGEFCPQTVAAVQQVAQSSRRPEGAKGVELSMQKYASFLPAPFNGLGIDANYTFINSDQPGAQAFDTLGRSISDLPVTGISKNNINAQLLFDQGPISARLAYSWRDDFLVGTSAYQTSGSYANFSNVPNTTDNGSRNQFVQSTYFALPVFQFPAGQLDANFTYRFTPHLTGVVEASNLTNTTTRLYFGSGDQRANRSWYEADRRYRVALRFSY